MSLYIHDPQDYLPKPPYIGIMLIAIVL